MAPFLITGVPAKTHPPPGPHRLEIREFIKDKKFFSLYIQALRYIYAEEQPEMLSFFQLAGIHSQPFVTWNQSPSEGKGYCVHGTNLFPTWHRPYVALFEQIIQDRAQKIAALYNTPDAAEWKTAAENLRQPFWDWSKNAIPPDEVISMDQVNIILSDGRTLPVDNPFLQYRFHPKEDSFNPERFRNWPTTLRNPQSDQPDAKSDVDVLKSRLSADQTNITRDTQRLFSIDSWPAFSNHSPSPGGSSNSLESIHDNIHGLTGGRGHMGAVPVAAFDPIFWLHHCQVDRLLALWASVHQDVWVPDADVNTALTPFWNTSSSYWASSNVRDFKNALNYSYPPAPELLPEGGAASGGSLSALSGVTQGLLASDPAAALIPNWTVRIRCNQYEIGGSFSIVLFLLDVPTQPGGYHTSSNYAGAFHAFVNDVAAECTNCQNQAEAGVEGFVHIDDAILDAFKRLEQSPDITQLAKKLDPSAVVPFLKDNLHWRILKADGTVVELTSLKSLEVLVLSAPLTLPAGAKFPVVGEPKHYHDITLNRPGGYRPA